MRGKFRTIKRQPKIGIFWLFGRRLLKAAIPLEHGVAFSGAINSPLSHVDFWPRLQRQHRDLRWSEYEEIPRGRVLFINKKNIFCVYMGIALHTPATKRRLLRAFNLPKDRTRFLTDPHYTTDPKSLDALFDE